jgi:hypothetical protein
MLHAYFVEVGPLAVGVVTREADGYRFCAIDEDSGALAAIRAIRGRLTPRAFAPRSRLYYLV